MSVDPDQSKRLIHCPPEVAYIPSSNSEKSTESLEWFYENLEMENEEISQHGQEGLVFQPQSPHSQAGATSASKWVADLESRTQFNFTNKGRIELAKQYMIGPAKEVLTSAILISGYDWEEVKDKIKEVYPEEDDFVKYRRELYTATRKPGETIT